MQLNASLRGAGYDGELAHDFGQLSDGHLLSLHVTLWYANYFNYIIDTFMSLEVICRMTACERVPTQTDIDFVRWVVSQYPQVCPAVCFQCNYS